MGAQFGIWNQDGKPVDRELLEKVTSAILPYGPDGGDSCIKSGLAVLYRAFHTTKESRREAQPLVTPSGAVITWDGRLDNRAELICQLRDVLTNASTDADIVGVAYERWGTNCLAKIVGDWTLSICNPHERKLILAKDFSGIRHLYYALSKEQVTWSSVLDPLVLFADRSFPLDEEYIAGWLSNFPAANLTPYHGIHAVPPSSYVVVQDGKVAIKTHWDFDPNKKIRCRSDAEYEDRFRTVFAEAVRRRLRSDSPILAELSGGMDSSSIVCVADTVLAQGGAGTPRLDTISYYDDSEPNWNERPYFTKVEEKRGRTGCHIDVGEQQSLKFDFDFDRFAVAPGSGGEASEAAKRFAAFVTSNGNRVLLSGTGGDESLGGVPTPTPELADLLARARLGTLGRQVVAWALAKRKPILHLLADTFRSFVPAALLGTPKYNRPPAWFRADFVKRNSAALQGYERRTHLFGALPSFQENVNTLDTLRRQLACSSASPDPLYDRRYPYLDRDLLEFLYAVPREQLVRPKQRRSLMRRALTGIVPDEVLNRKRKGFAVRGSMAAISEDWPSLFEMSHHMVSDSLGIVDATAFLETLQLARQGQEVPTVPLLRTLGIEFWLQQLTHPNWIRVIADAQHDSALTRISEHLAAKEKMESKRSQVRTAS
jgi:asparagine synthase (glutamine-hydrolysing)